MYRAYEYYSGRWEPRPKRLPRKSDAPRPTAAASAMHACTLLDDCRALVHPLVQCPPIAKGKRYLLVERKWWGQRELLRVGRARSPHESVNLARVRRTAAQLGANEVHILPT
jgi:hypothetical protein